VSSAGTRAVGGRGAGRPAFTLVELVVVMIVVATLAAVAVPSLAGVAGSRRAAAQRGIQRDLSYVRERAVCTGLRSWAVFNVAGNSYTLMAEPVGAPGRANAAVLADPATGRTFVRPMNSGELSGVSLVSAVFGGGAEVGFDWQGAPCASNGAALTGAGVVTLTGGRTVRVEAVSGLVTAP
jgi:prepilin-type N-terminal cleavage/methylation domain-containing protein